MARKHPKPAPTLERTLEAASAYCDVCHHYRRILYHSHRRLLTLEGIVALTLPVRACGQPSCAAYKKPVRPWQEGAIALPQAECGLDVVAFIGLQRYQAHQSVPEIHRLLTHRQVPLSQRTVTNLLARYEELVALRLADQTRLVDQLKRQGRVLLALDGMQPDVGHEVLWIVRDLLSGEVLLARSLLSAAAADLGALLEQVRDALPVPVVGVVSDAARGLRKAVAEVFGDVPHQYCQFHYLKEAVEPLYEADRHAKTRLKATLRGVRTLERSLKDAPDPKADPEGVALSGYCQAVRSALTDDGRPPLHASGLKLKRRLQAMATSIETVVEKGGATPDCNA